MIRGIVLGCIAAIACASIASSGTRFSTAEETDPIGPSVGSQFGSQVSQVPRCPGEKTAVSGGFQTGYAPGDPATPSVIPTTFRRARDKWYTGFANFGPTGGTVTTYAYCLETEVTISFEPSRAAGSPRSNSTSCGAGDVALSGGFVLDSPGNAIFDFRRESKRTWTVSVTNPAGTEAGLTAYAVCGKPKKTGLRPNEVSADAPFAAAGAGSTATARVACPAGRVPVSGGFSAPPGVVVHESKRFGKRSWEAAASSPAPVAGALTVYAYCV